MNETELAGAVKSGLTEACDSLSTVRLAVPAGEIIARGRARRRRRLAGIGLTGTAATAAAVLGLTGVLAGGPAPALATGTAGNSAGTVRTTAFTLVKNTNGTVKLTFTTAQLLNPDLLKRALAKDGVPALVTIGTHCTSHPLVKGVGAFLYPQLPDGTPLAGPSPSHPVVPIPRGAVTVINPAAIPAGTELALGYFRNDQAVTFGLIRTDSYTCVKGLPPGHPRVLPRA